MCKYKYIYVCVFNSEKRYCLHSILDDEIASDDEILSWFVFNFFQDHNINGLVCMTKTL